MDSLNSVSSALCERSWGNCASSAGGRGNASAPLGCACCCAGGCLMRLGERTSSLYEDPRLAPYEVGGAACAPPLGANASSEGATGTSSASKTTGFFHPDHVSGIYVRDAYHRERARRRLGGNANGRGNANGWANARDWMDDGLNRRETHRRGSFGCGGTPRPSARRCWRARGWDRTRRSRGTRRSSRRRSRRGACGETRAGERQQKTSRRGAGKSPLEEPKKQRASRGRAPVSAGRGDREWRTRRGFCDAHLKILHLLGPNAWTWLDASSMEMKRLRASFHLSLSLAVAASGAEAPGAPFWVLPCLPNR
mmetsp:Transcript_10276/g.42480  ORF Transcript_10276/g.42480 Transcript_10276/m.42480 type:complete len:310 (-) Transcript_10276:1293-2222(-)